MKGRIILAAIVITCIVVGCYVGSHYHTVTYSRYFQITDKYWKDDNGWKHTGTPGVWDSPDTYWLQLSGHNDVEVGSKNEWLSLNKGNYRLVEWDSFEENIR